MENIPNEYFDLIIIDPPYNKTQLDWDKPLDVNKIITQSKRILKETGTLLVFGQNPHLSDYITCAKDIFKYDLIWRKSRKNGYLSCQSKPLVETESIAVFSKGVIPNSKSNPKNRMTYNPIGVISRNEIKETIKKPKTYKGGCKNDTFKTKGAHYPTNIIDIPNSRQDKDTHPCEKPIDLFEYLILTYSNIGQRVFDPCFGSGNSLLAAKNCNRKGIGCEKNDEFFNKAVLKFS